MATRTLDVALRIATDLDGAVQDLRKMEDAQKRVELATSGLQRAHTKLAAVQADGKATADQLAKAKDGVTRAELALSTATERATKAQAVQSTGAKAATTAQAALATATQKTAAIQQRAGLSAGELRNAQRQLPAQITDIVTSLASGQSVFTVAIQQGGQIKDSFGGVGAASRALLGALSPTVLMVGGAAAVFAGIGLAMFQGYKESRAFESGLIASGYAAGVTGGQLNDMADDVGEATGKFADANAAMLLLSESGKFTGDSLQLAAQAAVNLSKLTGESIEDTTSKIIKLATAPSETLAKLNSEYHFLTATVYEHVRSLEEQGRAEDAARVAVEAFASVHEQRVREAEERAGFLERAWRGLGSTISGIWNGLKDLGRTDAEYRLQAAQQALGDAQARSAARGFPLDTKRYEAAIDAAKKLVEAEQRAALVRAGMQASEDFQIKASEEARKEAGKSRESAEREWDQRAIGDLDKKAKLEEKITEIRRQGALLKKSESEIDAQIANARARYKEGLPKGAKPGKTDAQQDQEAAARELANLEKQIALLRTLADGERRVTEEARVRYETTDGAYRLASATIKQQLIDQAKLVDAKNAEREAEQKRAQEVETTRRQYEQLSRELQTPIEAAIEDITSKINVLNKALADGTITAAKYEEELGRLFDQSFSKPPELQLPTNNLDDPTGLLRDQAMIDEARKQQTAWYAEQLALLEKFRLDKSVKQDEWDAKEKEVAAAQAAALEALKKAERDLQVNATQDIFDGMTSIMRSAAGEQSKAYRIMFAISKGFAIATAALNLGKAISEAQAAGPWPYNLPAIAAAVTQGAQIASLIASAVYTPQGYATGGRIVGPGTRTSDSVPIMASVDEHMIRAASATQPGARAFLDDFNDRGMPALYDWAQVGAYAEGGAITESMEPRARFGTPSASPVNLKNDMAMYLYQDVDALAGALAKHPAMRQAIVAETSENGQAIQMSWGSGS